MGVAEIATRTVQEETEEDPYKVLAYAIITHAIEEYRNVLVLMSGRLKQNRKPMAQHLWRASEIESFFNSEWFMLLSPVDGKRLMNILLNEHDYSELIKWRKTHDSDGNLIVDAEEHEDELCELGVEV